MKIRNTTILLLFLFIFSTNSAFSQEFQGKAYYFSKSTLDMSRFGDRMSEAQKKQMQARMQNMLEKTFILTFNKEESIFKEEEKLEVETGGGGQWRMNFTQGEQYKNLKSKAFIQQQEFFGKQFLVVDSIQSLQWTMANETKQIGNYMCFKAISFVPSEELNWASISWGGRPQNQETDDKEGVEEIPMTKIEAWYTPQLPVSHGPSEYSGLPGLILEVSAGNTTMLCTKIVINPEDKEEIKAPSKGEKITKKEYRKTVMDKMEEFRNNRMRRRD